ncbi:hypothetical protein [Micromonospora sp. NBC_01796]|uniref:hypothetical protein n=1 Tax=Micromonospora sp. NBC_01796 TaxID=2975987 RepID=UPI002DDA55AB|nr:hypothetical protein [Micromonospora sp. NBC_01796]WSA86198.1 hypothetical protein OIE47_00830 [Micromonospora sp. NBC_01796]
MAEAAYRRSTGWDTFLLTAALFVLFVLLAFSEEWLEPLYESREMIGPPREVLLPVDVGLLALLFGLGLWASRRGSSGRLRWDWFAVGSAFHLGLDYLVLARPIEERDGSAFVVTNSALYAVSLMVIGAAVLGWQGLPRFRPSGGGRDGGPVVDFSLMVPLVLGTFAAYLGAEYWDVLYTQYWNELHNYSPGEAGSPPPQSPVDHEYFAQVSQVIPLLLIAIGFEARHFHRHGRSPVGRAATIVTVLMLCVAEAMVLTVLPNADPTKTVAAGWHEYAAFMISIEACLIGLAMLLWALIPKREPIAQPAPPTTSTPPAPTPPTSSVPPPSAGIPGPSAGPSPASPVSTTPAVDHKPGPTERPAASPAPDHRTPQRAVPLISTRNAIAVALPSAALALSTALALAALLRRRRHRPSTRRS